MTTVFCTINSQYIHSSLAPWCLLAGVRQYGEIVTDAIVIEGTVNEPLEISVQRIVEKEPDMIGFSCYIWNIDRVRQIAAAIKHRFPRCFIFFGGPEVSYCARQILTDLSFVDAVISGEGERPVAMLLDAVASTAPLTGIPGVSYRTAGDIVIASPYLTEEEPPSPYVPEYFENLDGRIAYLETSRGCPFSCAFCLSGRCGTVRYYPMERVKRELIQLANSGTKTVKLVDRTFNAHKKRAKDIFRFLIDAYGRDIPTTVCFHFEIAGDLLDEETFSILSEAPVGLFQMEIGLQSFHEPTLDAVRRTTNMGVLIDNIRKLLSCGNIHVHIDLIAGLPYEDLSLFEKGFETAVALQPHMLQMGFLKLLHGAAMREEPDRFPCTYNKTPPYEVIETPWLSAADLQLLHGVETQLDRLYNSGRFRRTLHYLTAATGQTAFRVLNELATYMAPYAHTSLSLDAYTVHLFSCFVHRDGVDEAQLRDTMIFDRLDANPSGLLPDCLRVFPDQTKRLKRLADTDPHFARPNGVRRGAVCLSDGTTLAFADHSHKHPVTGSYGLRFFQERSLLLPYLTVLFDLDGTLTDPAEGITNSVAYALEKVGITVEDKTTLNAFIGPPLIDSFGEFYRFSPEKARQALSDYREYYAVKGIYQNTVYDGISELLADLKRQGCRLLVATSKPELYARRILDTYGLTPYFDIIAGSDMAEKRSEKSKVIAYALNQLPHIDRSRTVMVGDRKFDVLGAQKESLPSIGVLFGYGDRDELQQAGATHLAETVKALHRLLTNAVPDN